MLGHRAVVLGNLALAAVFCVLLVVVARDVAAAGVIRAAIPAGASPVLLFGSGSPGKQKKSVRHKNSEDVHR